MVKNLPSNAGDMGWMSGLGTTIPHAARQVSLRAATAESACHKQAGAPCALP